MLLIRLALVIPLMLLGVAIATPPAHAVTIALTVNGEPITSYDIDQRVKLMTISNEQGGRNKAIEDLIDETLQLQEAKARGFNPDPGRVDAAFATIAQRIKMTPAQLTQALASAGVQADSLKKRLRAQMTWQALVRARQDAVSDITEQDVTAALLASGNPEEMTLREFTLQQIVFVVPSGSSSGAVDQRRREAEAFRQRFQGCDSSIEQAKSLRGVVVKNIGRRDSTQLSGSQGEAIMSTGVGEATRPNQSADGIELIAVCSVREINSSAAARAEIESKLMLEASEESGSEYLAELRERAIIKHR